jgi:hypothetical protein
MLTFWIPDQQEEAGSLWRDEGWNRPLEEHENKLCLEKHNHHDRSSKAVDTLESDKGGVKMAWDRGNAYLYT